MKRVPRKYQFAVLAAAGQVGAAVLWGATGGVVLAGLLVIVLTLVVLSLRWDIRRAVNETRERARGALATFDELATIQAESLTSLDAEIAEHGRKLEDLLRSSGLARQDAELRHETDRTERERLQRTVTELVERTDALTRSQTLKDQQINGLAEDLSRLTKSVSSLAADRKDNLAAVKDVQQRLKVEGRDEPKRWRKRNDEMLRQVEAMINLHRLIQVRAEMPLSRGWALSPDALLTVVGRILDTAPDLVVECGSGTSSIWMGYAAEAAGNGTRIVCLEDDSHYANATRRRVRQHGLDRFVEVRDAPLVHMELHGEKWYWYDPDAWSDLTNVGLLLIDGPPEKTQALARYPAVPLLYDRLASDACIMLDDTRREDEQKALQRWLEEFKDLTATDHGHEKGTVELCRDAGPN